MDALIRNVGNTERLVTLAAGAALLGYAWRQRSRSLGLTSAGLLARGATGYCPAYAALGVNRGSRRALFARWGDNYADTQHELAGERGVHVRESITINASPEELYSFWRRYENLPQVMPHLERVEEVDVKLSRWTAKAFGQVPISWVAETINEVPFETIGWKTLPGEALQHAGSVVFKRLPENPPHHAGERVAGAPAGATDVRVHFQYSQPGGKPAAWFAAFLGQDPARLTREGLRALQERFLHR
jgi:uncharacterized membrane protein